MRLLEQFATEGERGGSLKATLLNLIVVVRSSSVVARRRPMLASQSYDCDQQVVHFVVENCRDFEELAAAL